MLNRRSLLLGFGAVLIATGAAAQTTSSIKPPSDPNETYSAEEIVDAGHKFFGKTARGLGQAIEAVFESQGRPSAYIVGEEGSGAFVGGLRYGEGTIYYKNGI